MRISKKGEYALRAMIHLAMPRKNQIVRLADVAAAEGIPAKFLEQIFLQLTRAGLLRSKRGKGGGYVFAASPDKISIGRIVRLIDGPLAPLGCVSKAFHVSCAREKNCALHDVMLDVRNAIAQILDNISLTDVCRRARRGQAVGATAFGNEARLGQGNGNVKSAGKIQKATMSRSRS